MDNHERRVFLDDAHVKIEDGRSNCCRSKHTKNCCIATAVLGGFFLVLGVVVMLAAGPYLEKKIRASMALVDGTERFESWLRPPVQPHLEAYAFHIVNPEAVLRGEKPQVKEVGPYVYKSVTLKDSDDNIKHWDDGTLTYRPRKVYTYQPALSGNKNPDNDFIIVPNIPYWTGMNKARKKSGFARNTAINIVTSNGLNEPFINVSFSGLLWGYKDELPCLSLDIPSECDLKSSVDTGFSSDDDYGFDDDDGFDSFGSDDGGFGDYEAGAESVEAANNEDLGIETRDKQFEPPADSAWELAKKPKAEFVDCSCNWGLFRDRNVTMRKPVRIMSGAVDIDKKGVVVKYDGKPTLGWWKKDSTCDAVKGQDSSTLPPGIGRDRKLDIYIALMCRTLRMEYEMDTEHAGIPTYRFVPPKNAMGSHDDPDPEMANPENECYCMQDDGYKCFKSGVMYMEPCKRDVEAPLALSMPHFYQADPSFREAVGGLEPVKEKHQFFMDVVPEFGFPLAIRPRFQLNVVIFGDPDVGKISGINGGAGEDLVMPFLWAQDGFDEPSDKMADAIAFGLSAPKKLPLFGAVVCFIIGSILVLSSLVYFFCMKRTGSQKVVTPPREMKTM